MNSLPIKDKDKFFNELNKFGYVTISNLMDSASLDYANTVLQEKLNVEELQREKIPGLSMGNLAIKSCFLHQKLWEEMKDKGLIDLLTQHFSNHKYVSFGGNLNLPGSKKQRLHVDTTDDNLTINISLVDVTVENGAVSVVDTNMLKPHTTLEMFRKKLYKQEKAICSNKGDVLLRFSSAWHRGNINFSKTPRMMLSFTLRRDFPYGSQEDKDRNLIVNKMEDSDIEFSGNIYPDNAFGRLMELADYRIPRIVKGFNHFRNIIKGQ